MENNSSNDGFVIWTAEFVGKREECRVCPGGETTNGYVTFISTKVCNVGVRPLNGETLIPKPKVTNCFTIGGGFVEKFLGGEKAEDIEAIGWSDDYAANRCLREEGGGVDAVR